MATKKRKKKPKNPFSETEIQKSFIRWVRIQPDIRLSWLHMIPNGSDVSIFRARIIGAEGLKPGVADISLPYPASGLHALYMEFKAPKRYQNKYQKFFQRWCEEHGYGYVVVKSLEEAIEAVTSYLNDSFVN